MEGLVLQTSANPTSLVDAVKAMAQQGRLNVGAYQDSLAYFRNRYFQGGEFTTLTSCCSVRVTGPLVEAVLSDKDNDPVDVVAALLLIIYRLRTYP
jgi:hypothetical protein